MGTRSSWWRKFFTSFCNMAPRVIGSICSTRTGYFPGGISVACGELLPKTNVAFSNSEFAWSGVLCRKICLAQWLNVKNRIKMGVPITINCYLTYLELCMWEKFSARTTHIAYRSTESSSSLSWTIFKLVAFMEMIAHTLGGNLGNFGLQWGNAYKNLLEMICTERWENVQDLIPHFWDGWYILYSNWASRGRAQSRVGCVAKYSTGRCHPSR